MLQSNAHKEWLNDRLNDLFVFGQSSKQHGGFGYLGENGVIDVSQNIQTYITCRMTHIYSMYVVNHQHDEGLKNEVGKARELAYHGVCSLVDHIQDHVNGGFFEAVTSVENTVSEGETSGTGGTVNSGVVEKLGVSEKVEDTGRVVVPAVNGDSKVAYAHAFVFLAASSAVYAKIPRSEELFEIISQIVEKYFWDETNSKTFESYTASWEEFEKYRGVNAAMHTVEAFLSVDSTVNVRPDLSSVDWLGRAKKITQFVFDIASSNSYMIPEHFDENWKPIWDYNVDDKAHQFRPYGATVGHAMEWARLGVHLVFAYYKRSKQLTVEDLEILKTCVGLYNVALQGWGVDGKDGFVYTTDFEGNPIVRDRMHWVLCEAIGASVALRKAKELLEKNGVDTGFMNPRYGVDFVKNQDNYNVDGRSEIVVGQYDLYEYWYSVFINYAQKYVITGKGCWNHQLDENNEYATSIWAGRPDIYHAYQALWFAKNDTIFLTNDM